ncbi:30S ribosomal protein S8 [Beggiatoa leptomitoformis]|uniref:Small ribosomal subunit protein uS8 n=1 Tax=Beggiatoa leptomitoformis TaxID=288004 RepID=A0A2N9YF18_9GAMM|nr:30S ribosomal protein S8 [Beggiatoa leptomitoformis]ALG68584.1 30S ribosomal protein S8 [Beggiatoa leptomitoformis]AUI69070.1 30S ribosomal protein S8 [Beggiatoa leptomitoformis]
MSMTDPIADMLTRIRNAQSTRKQTVDMPVSKIKIEVAKILKSEGYISDYKISDGVKAILTLELKYYLSKPVISEIKRISRPGLRIYKDKDSLPSVLNGLGIAIISTSKGLMTDHVARTHGHGGEVLCVVS